VTDRSNEAAQRGAAAILEVFASLPDEARRTVGLALAGDSSTFLRRIGPAVAVFGHPAAAEAIAAAIVAAVDTGEARELVASLPVNSPWSVVRAALDLADREGVDVDGVPEAAIVIASDEPRGTDGP
jgi:hypothetical protein